MNKKASGIFKIIALALCFSLVFEQSGFAQMAGELDLSSHFARLTSAFTQDKFRPLHLRYISYDNLNNSFKLLLDKGDSANSTIVTNATKDLLKYFFIGISLPNDSFWVNLRPDSPENIIDPLLEKTEVGKILLEADVQLKKDTANSTSPQTPEGKEYWDKLYKKAGELFGSENITIPTLTRPWIVPGEIIIRETQAELQGHQVTKSPVAPSAYIYKATLKVMLEQDYLKGSAVYNFKDERLKTLNEYSSQLIKELIIPKLTKDVNTSKRYASLRQVYYSLILAQWFKQKFYGKGGAYSWLIDKKNLNGLTSKESWSKTTYFNQYKTSFNQGEYNIKESTYTLQGQSVRNYMSGGINLVASSAIKNNTISSNRSMRWVIFLTAGLLGFSVATSDAAGLKFKTDDPYRVSIEEAAPQAVVQAKRATVTPGANIQKETTELTAASELKKRLIAQGPMILEGLEAAGIKNIDAPLLLRYIDISSDPKRVNLVNQAYDELVKKGIYADGKYNVLFVQDERLNGRAVALDKLGLMVIDLTQFSPKQFRDGKFDTMNAQRLAVLIAEGNALLGARADDALGRLVLANKEKLAAMRAFNIQSGYQEKITWVYETIYKNQVPLMGALVVSKDQFFNKMAIEEIAVRAIDPTKPYMDNRIKAVLRIIDPTSGMNLKQAIIITPNGLFLSREGEDGWDIIYKAPGNGVVSSSSLAQQVNLAGSSPLAPQVNPVSSPIADYDNIIQELGPKGILTDRQARILQKLTLPELWGRRVQVMIAGLEDIIYPAKSKGFESESDKEQLKLIKQDFIRLIKEKSLRGDYRFAVYQVGLGKTPKETETIVQALKEVFQDAVGAQDWDKWTGAEGDRHQSGSVR